MSDGASVEQIDPDSDQALVLLVDGFSKALLAKLRLAHANGRRGWANDDWQSACQEGLLRHIEKGDPRDVAAFCAFMWHHGWITHATPPAAPAGGEGEAVAYWVEHPKFGMELSLDPPNEDAERRGWVAKPLYLAAPAQSASGHDIEAAIERIISIRNGMTPDMEARAIVRRELAALGATAQSNGGEGTFERVFQDACNEAGCGYDNELLLTTIKGFRDQLAKARAALEEARQSLALADKMISEHIEEYHDFDYEPHQVPPELASLRAIEHHLMGSLILDEDIAALKDAQS